MGFFKRIRPVDVSTTVLDNVIEFLDKTVFGNHFPSWEQTVALTMKGIVSDAIREKGSDRVALNCEENFDEILEVIDEIFFGDRNMISYKLVMFSRLIWGEILPANTLVGKIEFMKGDSDDNA